MRGKLLDHFVPCARNGCPSPARRPRPPRLRRSSSAAASCHGTVDVAAQPGCSRAPRRSRRRVSPTAIRQSIPCARPLRRLRDGRAPSRARARPSRRARRCGCRPRAARRSVRRAAAIESGLALYVSSRNCMPRMLFGSAAGPSLGQLCQPGGAFLQRKPEDAAGGHREQRVLHHVQARHAGRLAVDSGVLRSRMVNSRSIRRPG